MGTVTAGIKTPRMSVGKAAWGYLLGFAHETCINHAQLYRSKQVLPTFTLE